MVHTPGQTELEDAQVALVSGKVPENVSEELILREFDSKQEIYIIFRKKKNYFGSSFFLT